MNKTLTALLLALTSAWAVDQNPVVEMYPDDMPKSQLVFQGNIPDECYHDKKYLGMSREKFANRLEKAFKMLNFEELSIDGTYWLDNLISRSVLFFGHPQEEDHYGFVFLDLRDSLLSLEPVLEKLPCKVHESVLTKEKWDYPRKVSYWNGVYENVNEMSWKYVDLIAHSMPNLHYSGQYFDFNFTEEKFYKTVRIKGLEQSVTRLSLIFNRKNKYGWNVIFNTEQEKEKSEKIITEINDRFKIY